MPRILLVDDSSHAQRLGERILSGEGYEVVTVSNADSALIRLEDVDPDVVLADTVMPGRTGFELCQYLKMSPRHRHVRVLLTAGILEPLDEEQVRRVGADASLKKPFEASVLIAAIKPLAEAAVAARAETSAGPAQPAGPAAAPALPFVAVIDAEQVRAAITVALDASMAALVDELTTRVLAALNTKKSVPPEAPAEPELPKPVDTVPQAPVPMQAVRRVTTLRTRPGSILGLTLGPAEPEDRDDKPSPS